MKTIFNPSLQDILLSLWRPEISAMPLNSKTNKIIQMLHSYYLDNDRYYHGAMHIQELLQNYYTLFRSSVSKTEDRLIQTAIIFHDAIYLPWESNNEKMSANFAEVFLNIILPTETVVENNVIKSKIWSYIMATDHSLPKTEFTESEKIISDLDLLIFADMDTLEKRTSVLNDLRFEYFFVPDKIFLRMRQDFLKDMLKKQIYQTDTLKKWEQIAKENIRNSIKEIDNILSSSK